MATKIQSRRGTAVEWAVVNPILSGGEIGLETDTRKFKIGDGVTPWAGLLYATQGEKGDIGYYINTSATDAYAITIDGITDYSQLIGVPLLIKFTIANSSSCSLNVSGLGTKNICRGVSTALLTGDILANMVGIVVYDGTQFQLKSQGADVSQASKSETLSNKTLTAPKLATNGFIADANGNELIKATAVVASAVNEITVRNAIAGNAPGFDATGGDPNIDMELSGKGTGVVKLNGVDPVDLISTHTGEVVSQQLIATRDISVGGVQTITGLTKIPKRIEIRSAINNGAALMFSVGSWEANGPAQSFINIFTQTGAAVSGFSTSSAVGIAVNTTNYTNGVVQNVTSSQFEINWTKTGLPTGTITLEIIAHYH